MTNLEMIGQLFIFYLLFQFIDWYENRPQTKLRRINKDNKNLTRFKNS